MKKDDNTYPHRVIAESIEEFEERILNELYSISSDTVDKIIENLPNEEISILFKKIKRDKKINQIIK